MAEQLAHPARFDDAGVGDDERTAGPQPAGGVAGLGEGADAEDDLGGLELHERGRVDGPRGGGPGTVAARPRHPAS
ncbi:hypothetical protein [Phycicoccus sp. HDW14]|uniref:hypothetical protein n=1 Tax=Phycicoccus sp. HDW14 TaxID=2714941 RepID=UPI001F0FC3FB|nr:hypothetical protein [Phycicoccus sp. HDW14]